MYTLSDLINNMDHTRISGTEPLSVILSQKMKFKKLKSEDPKVPKQAEAKRDLAILYDINPWKPEPDRGETKSPEVIHFFWFSSSTGKYTS